MVKQSFLLDPNAQAYTDDDIVAKLNSGSLTIIRDGFANIGILGGDLDDVDDGSSYVRFAVSEQTKLSGVEDSATADQTGTEVRDLIVGLAETTRKIVITDPTSGQYPVLTVQRASDGKLKVEYDDTAV